MPDIQNSVRYLNGHMCIWPSNHLNSEPVFWCQLKLGHFLVWSSNVKAKMAAILSHMTNTYKKVKIPVHKLNYHMSQLDTFPFENQISQLSRSRCTLNPVCTTYQYHHLTLDVGRFTNRMLINSRRDSMQDAKRGCTVGIQLSDMSGN